MKSAKYGAETANLIEHFFKIIQYCQNVSMLTKGPSILGFFLLFSEQIHGVLNEIYRDCE